MIYLNAFQFPNVDEEEQYLNYHNEMKKSCYDTIYPFRVLQYRLEEVVFDEPITIFYGGNGSGKSTALNIIAEKIKVERDSIFNKSSFYPDFLELCSADIAKKIPANSRIITSDDVFDYMLNIRNLNEGIDQKREEIFEEYLDAKHSKFQMRSMADYEQLKKVNQARSTSQSKFVRSKLMNNVREYSNGESAYNYFTEKIGENGLFILDEPENSLSPKMQLELAKFIEDSARFFNCQIIMSTHSPFLLAMKGAKIYNLDETPACVRKWTDLENVRLYQKFFEGHSDEFQK
jgi:predicted ATPase